MKTAQQLKPNCVKNDQSPSNITNRKTSKFDSS